MLGHIPSSIPMPIGLSFPTALLPMMMKSALILAVLGGIDSLLTSLVADNLTDTYHDSDKEMVGQGIGNAVAGLFGGIPSAGMSNDMDCDKKTPASAVNPLIRMHSIHFWALLLGHAGCLWLLGIFES